MFYGTIFFLLLERTTEATREDHIYEWFRERERERLLHHTWTWKLKALINSGRCMSFIIIIVIGKTAAVAAATAEISSKSVVVVAVVVAVKLLQWRELINLEWCVWYTSRSLLLTPLSQIINSGIANFIRISIKFWMACVRVCVCALSIVPTTSMLPCWCLIRQPNEYIAVKIRLVLRWCSYFFYIYKYKYMCMLYTDMHKKVMSTRLARV